MRPGPKPRAAAEKIREGITAPSDVNLQEPLPALEPPATPDELDLDDRATAIYREVLRLQAPGLITRLDDGLLQAYAEIREQRERQGKLLKRTGLVIRGRKDAIVRNPVFVAWREAVLLEIRLGGELGIGPSARAGIHFDPGDDGTDLPDIGPSPRLRVLRAPVGDEA